MGRHIFYTPELGETICARLMDGESLRAICLSDDMPNRGTVVRWMEGDAEFAAKCARARVLQADLMDDMILDTALACTSETAAADRVKIGAFQWRAARLMPKVYGDKQMHTGPDGGPAVLNFFSGVPRPE